MTTVTKTDLAEAIAEFAGISKSSATLALDGLTKKVTESLVAGNDVALVGFGTWTTADRAAREGRNPQTGAMIKIPASRVAKFKVGKKLKDAVNDK